MKEEFNAYGFTLEVKSREKLENAVKMAFLKTDSQGGLLILKDLKSNKSKLQIKLEIDTNPPEGSQYELKYLDFPLTYSIKTQDLPSLFAGKCNALLCRNYQKGRDWYDFIWYVARQVQINFVFLNNAIAQADPWKEKNITVTPQWFFNELKTKITTMNWDEMKRDIVRFLKPHELPTLDLWSEDFFISRVDKLSKYISS